METGSSTFLCHPHGDRKWLYPLASLQIRRNYFQSLGVLQRGNSRYSSQIWTQNRLRIFYSEKSSNCRCGIVGAGICIASTFFNVVGYPASVSGQSMSPTLNDPNDLPPEQECDFMQRWRKVPGRYMTDFSKSYWVFMHVLAEISSWHWPVFFL